MVAVSVLLYMCGFLVYVVGGAGDCFSGDRETGHLRMDDRLDGRGKEELAAR